MHYQTYKSDHYRLTYMHVNLVCAPVRARLLQVPAALYHPHEHPAGTQPGASTATRTCRQEVRPSHHQPIITTPSLLPITTTPSLLLPHHQPIFITPLLPTNYCYKLTTTPSYPSAPLRLDLTCRRLLSLCIVTDAIGVYTFPPSTTPSSSSLTTTTPPPPSLTTTTPYH